MAANTNPSMRNFLILLNDLTVFQPLLIMLVSLYTDVYFALYFDGRHAV